MSSFYKQLCQHSFISIGKRVLVHVGTFKYSIGVGPIEIQTFRDGVAFGEDLKANQDKMVQYRMLVDDIGIPAEKRKKIKEKFKLPFAYVEILDQHNLSEEYIDVVFESQVRNKASHLISRGIDKIPGKDLLIKEALSFEEACEYERCVPQSEHAKDKKEDKEIYSILDPYSGIPLILKEGPNPKCNFIIACSYFNGSDKYDSIISFYNALWEQRMHYGGMVARYLFDIRIPIIDFFYFETKTEPKLVINNEKELQGDFSLFKTNLFKQVLLSDIDEQLKDEYLVQIENTIRFSTLKKLEKKLKPIINLNTNGSN